MKAHVGEEIVVHGHRVGDPERKGEILEVRGEAGGPPYLVRWDQDGTEGLFFPESDAAVKHLPHANA